MALPDVRLRGMTFLAEPAEPGLVAEEPVPPEEVRVFDAELPPVVDAWIGSLGAAPATRS
jgi:hypothetical protein